VVVAVSLTNVDTKVLSSDVGREALARSLAGACTSSGSGNAGGGNGNNNNNNEVAGGNNSIKVELKRIFESFDGGSTWRMVWENPKYQGGKRERRMMTLEGGTTTTAAELDDEAKNDATWLVTARWSGHSNKPDESHKHHDHPAQQRHLAVGSLRAEAAIIILALPSTIVNSGAGTGSTSTDQQQTSSLVASVAASVQQGTVFSNAVASNLVQANSTFFAGASVSSTLLSVTSSVGSSSSASDGGSGNDSASVAGLIIGILCAVAAVVVGAAYFWARRRESRANARVVDSSLSTITTSPAAIVGTTAPPPFALTQISSASLSASSPSFRSSSSPRLASSSTSRTEELRAASYKKKSVDASESASSRSTSKTLRPVNGIVPIEGGEFFYEQTPRT
jgi:hypothetical protein